MVPPASHKVSRVSWYSGSQPTLPIIVLDGTLTLYGHAFQRVGVIGSCLLLVLQPQSLVAQPLVWAAPGSLATTTGISVDFFSSGY